jgi:hypothetical protein
MKIKSKMLGEIELVARPDKVKSEGDHLILYCHTEQPAQWNVRVAFEHRDITRMIKMLLTSSAPLFLVSGLRSRKNPKPPQEF